MKFTTEMPIFEFKETLKETNLHKYSNLFARIRSCIGSEYGFCLIRYDIDKQL